jgi:glutamine synthetase
VRSPDPTCNPYLTYAVMLAAGLDGLERRLPLPPETVGDAEIGVFLPMSLNDALGAMAADPLIAEVLGAELAEKFQAIKRAEWQAYMTTVHDWEQARYFTGY